MSKIKKIGAFLFLPLLFMIVLSGCKGESVANKNIAKRIKNEPTIVWGVKYDTRLFGMMDIKTRKVEGFDIDIAKAITKEILGKKGKAEFIEVTSKTRIPLLKNGNIDTIIATMTITDERKEQVDFSDIYFDAGQSLLVKKGSPIKNVKSLTANDTVLAVKGSTSSINIRKNAPDAKILELENYAEAFTALQSGQGQAMTTDNAILLGMASENNKYELAGGTFTNEPYGIAINKGQEDFLKEVNNALSKMHDNGTYDKIFEKWFPKDAEGRAKKGAQF
ncbi:transporter substrate-binding domain-containing protein [Enterococcus dongliensis]|uniref:Transporter substrate-binding domain-containing protein n=1 Tax=Enterococcus dongliensis TaxID=2559925 RepID=A0AAP5KPS2_9ENTE|nr:transporter substrate-binding domain-containing protein [Enterococcus dongliensis]MDT2595713.1 transporter substrate-binding domain-containing protein [Enterococcus dongliensis]MDT2602673.1 transporter substrate-binding domain-containing protein [Enterococcus dongliensis]MDT2612134.1 transporter substrate-binding domain-containing protein [Enterococcus dongliensis]MDT2633839.1 transporter substrate-binding domain-containing protein [Enterococcus dongliensis]MDT2636326.1 transporter substrat